MNYIINFFNKFNFSNNIVKNIDIVIQEAFHRFIGNGSYHILYLFMILLLLFYDCKKQAIFEKIEHKDIVLLKRKKVLFIIYALIIFLLSMSNYFAVFYIQATDGDYDTYWRVFWMLPIPIGIGYLLTKLVTDIKNNIKKIFTFIIVILILATSGQYTFTNEEFKEVHNLYKLPDDMVEIVEYLSSIDNNYKKLMGSNVFCTYTRLIDGRIILDEGRHDLMPLSEYSMINYANNNQYYFIKLKCIENSINYIAFEKQLMNNDIDSIENYDFEIIYENDIYALYHFDESLMKINNY